MIDQPNSYSQPQASYFPVALRYGLILGGISIAISLIGYLTNTDPASPETSTGVKLLYQVLAIGATIGAIVMAIKTHRDRDLGGFIGLGRATMVGLMTGLIAGAVAGVFVLLYTQVINPGYLDTMRDMATAQMEEQGLSEEQIEMASQMSGTIFNPVMLFVTSLVSNLIFGALIGLIAGAVMKRERR